MKLDLRHLQQIATLAKHKNFARAAQELNISQPGLSQSIRLLEQQLGYKLFDRHPREVSPTVFGQRALQLGQPILLDSFRLEREMKMLANLEIGSIRIGFGPLAAEVLLAGTVGKLAADFPGISIRTKVEDVPGLIQGLNDDNLDVLVCDTRYLASNDEYRIAPLPSYPIHFVCRSGHPLASKKHVSLEDIFQYQIASPELPSFLIKKFSSMSGLNFSTMDEIPNGYVQAPYHLLPEIITRCDAISLGIVPVFQKGIQRGDLHLLPQENFSLMSHYEIISLKRYSVTPAIQVFHEYVLHTSGEPES